MRWATVLSPACLVASLPGLCSGAACHHLSLTSFFYTLCTPSSCLQHNACPVFFYTGEKRKKYLYIAVVLRVRSVVPFVVLLPRVAAVTGNRLLRALVWAHFCRLAFTARWRENNLSSLSSSPVMVAFAPARACMLASVLRFRRHAGALPQRILFIAIACALQDAPHLRLRA